MKLSTLPRALCAAAALLWSAHAAADPGITDPAGDFLPTYTGAHTGDLDVLSAFVTYDPGSNSFFFSSTFAAPIGTTSTAFYVWGFDRGQGTERFVGGTPSVGAGVRFDSVVVFRLDGSATVNRLVGGGSSALPGAVTFAGNTVSATINAGLLPSLGLAPSAFTWNLWPRDGAVPAAAGVAAISDFAPDGSNVAVSVSPVPEPETYALFALGLGVVGFKARRRAAAGTAGKDGAEARS